MAMNCKKCGGIMPDIMIGVDSFERSDCKNHTKPEINIREPKKYGV